jgi:1-acyl-sn-glycerol-3-phosphate acyltransferase
VTMVMPAVAPPTTRRPVFTVAVYAWSGVLLTLHLVLAAPLVPYMLLADRDRTSAARLGSWLARSGLWMPRGWRDAARHLAEIRLDRPAVIVMNHRSIADTALAVGMPGAPKIGAKPWAARVPLLALNMRLCGHVLFDPSSPQSVRRMMSHFEGVLARGQSVLFFPEGTRRVGPGLGHFHDGAFQLAVRAGVDVLPVVLHGTGDLVPRGSLVFHDAPVDVEPLPRIAPGTDRRELSQRVREAMAAALARR